MLPYQSISAWVQQFSRPILLLSLQPLNLKYEEPNMNVNWHKLSGNQYKVYIFYIFSMYNVNHKILQLRAVFNVLNIIKCTSTVGFPRESKILRAKSFCRGIFPSELLNWRYMNLKKNKSFIILKLQI